jgi:hypothetical protein
MCVCVCVYAGQPRTFDDISDTKVCEPCLDPEGHIIARAVAERAHSLLVQVVIAGQPTRTQPWDTGISKAQTHTYIHTYIYTYIHTHTRTYIQAHARATWAYGRSRGRDTHAYWLWLMTTASMGGRSATVHAGGVIRLGPTIWLTHTGAHTHRQTQASRRVSTRRQTHAEMDMHTQTQTSASALDTYTQDQHTRRESAGMRTCDGEHRLLKIGSKRMLRPLTWSRHDACPSHVSCRRPSAGGCASAVRFRGT